jgi:hypothetical protein
MVKIDLHTHSTASDGTLTPEELVRRAKQHGVAVLSLTDHDTTQDFHRSPGPAKSTMSGVSPGWNFPRRRRLRCLSSDIDSIPPVLCWRRHCKICVCRGT